jgi:hypothetical protein
VSTDEVFPAKCFDDIPSGDVFRGPDGNFYQKLGDSFFPVKRTRSGWIGYGVSRVWNPEWDSALEFHLASHCPLTDEELRSLSPARSKKWGISVALVLITAFVLWLWAL